MLSDRARKWLRTRFEKWAGTFYDGPKPPARLREQAEAFANMFPNATRKQWADFAVGFAEEAWRSAYLQGVEWAEREPFDTYAPPELIMDQIDASWRDSPSVLEDPERVVPDNVTEGELQAREIAAFNPRPRRF